MGFPRVVADRTRFALIGAGLLLLVSLVLKDGLLGGAYYERDLLAIHMPMSETFVRTIAEGSWPFRDPTTGFGQPMLGNPDAQIPYPTTWLHLLMLPEQAYLVFLTIHYFLGATGAAALAWRFSRSGAAAFFAGALWVVGGPLQSFLSLWHHLAGATWMPWVLTAFDRVLEKPDRPRTLLLAGAFGLQILAGSAEMCAMTLALSALRLVCELPGTSRSCLPTQVKATFVALLLAIGLGAATWLSVLDVWRFSNRAALPEEVRMYWSLHPWMLAEIFMPLGLGSLDLGQTTRSLLFGAPSPFLRSVFLGSLTLPLVFAALFTARIPRKYRVFAGVGALVALLLALGKHTPIYSLLSTIFPVLQIFRYPVKVLVTLSLLLAVLSGVALRSLRDEPRAARAAAVTALALLALHLAVFAGLPAFLPPLISGPPEVVSHSIETVRTQMLLSVGTLVLLLVGIIRPAPGLVSVAGLAAVGSTLVSHFGLNPVVEPSALRFRPDFLSALQTAEPSRVYVEDYVSFPDLSRRFLGRPAPFNNVKGADPRRTAALVVGLRTLMIPPQGASWGVQYAWDTDLRRLFDQTLHDLTICLRMAEGTPTALRMLQIGNVSGVLALHSSSFHLLGTGPVFPSPLPEPLRVFRVPDALPRAYAVSGIRIADAAQAVTLLLDPEFTPVREVILDGGTATPSSPTFRSSVIVTSLKADRIALDVQLNQPGTVVLLEGFLPGWQATLDGQSVQVQRANALFVAAFAPAGHHQIVFTYRPWSGVLGLAISALTALGLLAGLLHRPRPAPTVMDGSTEAPSAP